MKKEKSDKFVKISSWVEPKHRVKVKKEAKRLKVKESKIIRSLIETL